MAPALLASTLRLKSVDARRVSGTATHATDGTVILSRHMRSWVERQAQRARRGRASRLAAG